MDILMNMLHEIEQMVRDGKKEKSAYEQLIKSLDIRTNIMLKQLNYDKNDGHLNTQLFRQTDDERLAEAKRDFENLHKNLALTLPYGVSAIIHSISNEVRNSLLAFATEFKYSGRLSFTISFRSFGPDALAGYSNRVSGKEAGEKRLADLKGLGLMVKEREKRFGYEVIDCDSNRNFLTLYFNQKFGAKHIEFRSSNKGIDEARIWMDLSDYNMTAEEQPSVPEVSDMLTDDEMSNFQKAISDYKFALANYSQMLEGGSGNLVLGLLESYVYRMEQLIGCHYDIWERKEAEHSESRRINGEIHKTQDAIKEISVGVAKTSGITLYNKLSEKLIALVKPFNLYVDEFSLGCNEMVTIRLMTNSYFYRKRAHQLEGQTDGRDPLTFYVYASQKNIDIIDQLLRGVMPSSRIESYEVMHSNEAGMVLKEIRLSVYMPSDLQRLMDWTVPENSEEDNDEN